MKKKRRTPEVLHRAYGARARTLADTILSLLPSPPPLPADCQCKGRRCLGCSGADARSFLIRDGDDSDYVRLLTQAYAVISDSAPPLPAFCPRQIWQQKNIVRNTIEMMKSNSSETHNILCSGHVKETPVDDILQFPSVLSQLQQGTPISPFADALCTSAWSCLLSRIGDNLMVHLLKHASIFFPLSSENHLQVTGPPINESFWFSNTLKYKRFATQMGSKHHKPAHVALHFESGQMKGKAEIEQTSKSEAHVKQPAGLFGIDTVVPVISDIGSKPRKRMRPFSWQRRRKRMRMKLNFPDENLINDCSIATDGKKNSSEELKSSNVNSGNSENQPERSSYKKACADSQIDLLPKVVYPESERQDITMMESKKVTSHCFHCLMLKAPPKHQIKRQSIFYNSGVSNLIFPRNHILNRLKPSDAGAKSLLRQIFGLPDGHETSDYFSCIESNGSCIMNSNCSYHSLLGFLKTLIHNVRRCQHLKLLHKHCSVPTSRSLCGRAHGFALKENLKQSKNQRSLFRVLTIKKKYPGLRSLSDRSLAKPYGHVNHQQKHVAIRKPKADINQSGLSRSYCKHEQVVSFVWAVCRSIIPVDLLGDPSNWRALRRNISKLIQLRRFEIFSLKQCLHGIKMSCFPFLLKVAESSYSICSHSKKDALGKGANMLETSNKSGDKKTIIRRRLFESWILWFFSCFVVPIVPANFYVTESESGRRDIYYYRKLVWKKLMNRAIGCLEERNYSLLDDKSFESILRKRSYGFSKVRFLVKENGVRPLANLRAPSKAWLSVLENISKSCTGGMDVKRGWLSDSDSFLRKWKLVSFKSVNSVLRELYAVLKRIKNEDPENLGSSVFDYNDIYKKLCPFLVYLRKGSLIMPQTFIVIGDVSKAFDSVKQDKLLSVMKNVLCSSNYNLKRYAKVVCKEDSLRVHYDPIYVDQSSTTDVMKHASCVPLHSTRCVLVDQVRMKQIKQETLHRCLEEHVKRNILQLGGNFYLQEVGIPQGSVLSTLLCSFYYGHLERNVILPLLEKISKPCNIGCGNHSKLDVTDLVAGNGEMTFLGNSATINLDKTNRLCMKGEHDSQNDDSTETNDGCFVDENVSSPKYMLMRLIDDFLFLSTSKKQAMRFFSRLQKGFSDYNCSMNSNKFCMNFDLDNQSQLLKKQVYTGEDGVSFLPWAGLLVNCDTLEIQADYTRYWGIHMSSTLTVWAQDKPGFHLKRKLCDYMRPKCHPIFYDSNINSPAIVRLNAYQAFLLCAMKFHCYVCAVPNTGGRDPNYHLEIIQRSLWYMYKLLKKRMHGIELTSNIHPILQLKKEELEWLGLSAYVRVLRKKQSRHRQLLSLLRSKVQAYGRMESTSVDLKYAVDDSHSSLFWKIKY